MRINLGVMVVTIESKPNAIGSFIEESLRPGDGRTFALTSFVAVVGGALLAWFA